nr:MAG TPA: hypothetical protein [Bacteriophage sp.]
MTTSSDSTQETAMQSTNEIPAKTEDRPLSVLLGMDSYQGMTDSEIASVIDFKERIARANGMTDASIAVMMQKSETLVQQSQESCANSQKVLESLLNRPVTLVSNDGSMENGK